MLPSMENSQCLWINLKWQNLSIRTKLKLKKWPVKSKLDSHWKKHSLKMPRIFKNTLCKGSNFPRMLLCGKTSIKSWSKSWKRLCKMMNNLECLWKCSGQWFPFTFAKFKLNWRWMSSQKILLHCLNFLRQKWPKLTFTNSLLEWVNSELLKTWNWLTKVRCGKEFQATKALKQKWKPSKVWLKISSLF